MKINSLSLVVAVLFAALIALGNSGGRATAANSGNTGAPGDAGATCITCHGNDPTIEVSLDIAITDGDGTIVDNYEPGRLYQGSVTLNVLEGNPAAHGFQIVALDGEEGENGPSINTFADPADDVQITTISSGRQYAEHNGPNQDDNVFEFTWTAPEAGTGTVTFYSCGNGVNLNGSTGGDNAACGTLSLTERPVSTPDRSLAAELTVYPNPVDDVVNLRIDGSLTGVHTVRITSVAGQTVSERAVTLTGGSNQLSIPAYDLTPGAYYVQLTDGTRSAVVPFLRR